MKKQADKIKRVGLMAHSGKIAGTKILQRAASLIRSAGREVLTDSATAAASGVQAKIFPDARSLAEKADLLLVFGGDGTMLGAAREIAGSTTPMLGINIGGLGFLTAVPSDGLARALQLVWSGGFAFESRVLAEVTGRCDGEEIHRAALNDVVVGRGIVSRLIELQVDVNHDPVTRYRCDGLIVSTPTGSTAYSLAAGGALVYPTAEVFALTPINPHTLSNRSLILPLSSTIRITAMNPKPATIISADGEVIREMQMGDQVTIRRSRRTVRLMHLAGSSFFKALQAKLHWRGANV